MQEHIKTEKILTTKMPKRMIQWMCAECGTENRIGSGLKECKNCRGTISSLSNGQVHDSNLSRLRLDGVSLDTYMTTETKIPEDKDEEELFD